MKRDRFLWVRMENEAGRDAFVKNPISHEEGLVMECSLESMIVRTSSGSERTWNYTECEELPIMHNMKRWC